jgi:multidrug efflux pump subunit AcrA (membrane-fusion protein)
LVSWFLHLLIFIVSAAGMIILMKTGEEGNAEGPKALRRVLVDVQELNWRRFSKVVEAYTTVSPIRKSTVSAQVTGPISEISPGTDPGDAVLDGQGLARIEDTRLRIAHQKAEASWTFKAGLRSTRPT